MVARPNCPGQSRQKGVINYSNGFIRLHGGSSVRWLVALIMMGVPAAYTKAYIVSYMNTAQQLLVSL
jgi:hypothetical protein